MKPIILFCLLLAFSSYKSVAQTTACDSLKKVADSLYHNDGDLQEIVNIYTQNIALNCSNLEQSYNNRGSIYNSLEKFDSAFEDLTKAYHMDTADGAALANLAVACSYMKKYDTALFLITKAIYRDSTNATFYKLRADIRTDVDDYAGSEKDYKKSISLDKHYIDGQEGLIVLYKMMVRKINSDDPEYDSAVDKVLKAYSSAMADNADHPYIQVERGHFYYTIGLDSEAIADFSVYLKKTPQSYRTFVDRALAYEHMGEHDKALRDYNASIAAKENYLAYYDRGRLYHKWYKNIPKAIKDNLKCIELAPGYATAYLNLGNCYIDLKEYDKAKAAYEQGMKQNPDANTKSKLQWQLDRFK